MSRTSMAIFSNPLFATYSVYAHNASNVDKKARKTLIIQFILHCLFVPRYALLYFNNYILHAHTP